MKSYQRIEVKLPLESLWNEVGPIEAEKVRELGKNDIKILLGHVPFSFVIADAGHPLQWKGTSECFGFWKTEVQLHLFEPSRARLEDYPDEYFYFAYEWRLSNGMIVVVLEKRH